MFLQGSHGEMWMWNLECYQKHDIQSNILGTCAVIQTFRFLFTFRSIVLFLEFFTRQCCGCLCALTGFWYVVHTAHIHSLRYMSIWWCFILFDKALSIQNYRFIGLFVQTVENDFSLNLNFGLYFIYSLLLYATLFPIVSFYCFSLFRLLFMCLCAFFYYSRAIESPHKNKITKYTIHSEQKRSRASNQNLVTKEPSR